MAGRDGRAPAAPLAVAGLVKRYGPLAAVAGVDFAVARGECVGLLGPNGAGKTTTIRMITGYTPITAGRVLVFGLDVAREPRAAKARLGVCPQEDNLDPDFTVEKNLRVYARYFRLPAAAAAVRARELVALVGLQAKAGASIRELSGGMKRRLLLARALIHRPALLVLDEPTTGLDPEARLLLWALVSQLKSQGVTVLLTTHYMEEAFRLCDRVLLMSAGRILLAGPPAELVAREIGQEVVELWGPPAELLAWARARGLRAAAREDHVAVYDPGGAGVAAAALADFPGRRRLVRPANLEDVFLAAAGRSLAVPGEEGPWPS